MRASHIEDPRLEALFRPSDSADRSVRPTVRLRRKGLSPIALVLIVLGCAVLLFLILNGRRTRLREPNVQTTEQEGGAPAFAPPPPLYLPPAREPTETSLALVPKQPVEREITPVAPTQIPGHSPWPQPRLTERLPDPPITTMLRPPNELGLPRRSFEDSPLMIDDSGNPPVSRVSSEPAQQALVSPNSSAARVRASAFANPSTTVSEGTLIPAVLETGFDSTKAGYARAIVSTDVRGFDGTRVLIPRGSRLVGSYTSEVSQGQKRALINWTRLIRPDGMTVTLDSPASDGLGRGGVAASVNSHFLARLGNALLQSTLDIGGALAGRAVSGPIVVLPSGSTANGQLGTPSSKYVPTLRVSPGKSISVFVAHDLDFSGAGEAS